jgi:uncharacterized protein (DUF2147 family)
VASPIVNSFRLIFSFLSLFSIGVSFFFTLFFVLPVHSEDYKSVLGLWKTVDEHGNMKFLVKVFKKNGLFFAKITQVNSKYLKTCKKCKMVYKEKSLVGMEIIKNLKKKGESYTGGTLLDIEDGNTYSCEMKKRGNQLEVISYSSVRIARRQIWIK